MPTALLIGASGLTGSACLAELTRSGRYTAITCLVRKPLDFEHPKLSAVVVDFDNLDRYAEAVRGDDIYCALGTTIRHAGSKERFRQIDFEYPLKVGELAIKNGAKQFILVSAVGANPDSGVFYLKVKGDLEQALGKLPFSALHIFRPAMLVGDRGEKRLREELGVIFATMISPLLVGSWKRYRSVRVDELARAMVARAATRSEGVHFYSSDAIHSIARELK